MVVLYLSICTVRNGQVVVLSASFQLWKGVDSYLSPFRNIFSSTNQLMKLLFVHSLLQTLVIPFNTKKIT